ncbi:MAG: FG-GAP repeat protein [Deltaproteobacteria bacterium]|nr:FG-GAP repeat protein [Deltaproteobacteria bacterium]
MHAAGDISGDGIDDLIVATADERTQVLISGPP